MAQPGKRKEPKRTRRAGATDWSPVADWYDQLVGESGSEFHQHVVLPGVMKLLNVQAGEACLDVACGQGVLCRLLQRAGAEVTGVDGAPALIRAAKDRGSAGKPDPSAGRPDPSAGRPDPSAGKADPRAGKPERLTEIRYHVGDARELEFLPAEYFHAASCVLAIQNIHPIAPVMTGVSRALRPGGRFVIVMMHPCFRGAKETSWGWDEAAKVQYRRVDRYLEPRKTPIVARPGADREQTYTWTFHKPIEAYARALRGAGLLIDAIEEWPSHKTSTSGPRAAAENRARAEIPMFMAIRAIKA